MARKQHRFMVVVAHPHDFTHSAGTCGVQTALGDHVTLVCMTAGSGTHDETLADELRKPKGQRDPEVLKRPLSELAAEKEKELRSAAALFGVTDIRFLDFPDKPFILDMNRSAVDVLREIILEIRPHVMITQSPYLKGPHGHMSGLHNDHTETAYASLEAQMQASLPKHGTEDTPYNVPATYFPGVYFNRDEWDLVVDISEWHEQRVQAEATYVTQGHTLEWSRKRMDASIGTTGWYSGTRSAEAFVRQGVELLPNITLDPTIMDKGDETHAAHLESLLGASKGDSSS